MEDFGSVFQWVVNEALITILRIRLLMIIRNINFQIGCGIISHLLIPFLLLLKLQVDLLQGFLFALLPLELGFSYTCCGSLRNRSRRHHNAFFRAESEFAFSVVLSGSCDLALAERSRRRKNIWVRATLRVLWGSYN